MGSKKVLIILLLFYFVLIGGMNKVMATPTLTISSPTLDLNNLSIGQTIQVDVTVSGLSSSDAMTVLGVQTGWSTEILAFSNVVWGPIIPDLSGINSQLTEEYFSGEDMFTGYYCTESGFTGVCINLADPSMLLNANGIFYSFDLTALSSGSGYIYIYSIGNWLPDHTHVIFNFGNTRINFTVIPDHIDVAIDIKPGSYPNSINLGSKGTVPVAIFSTTAFDATTVDPTTVTLAGAQVAFKGKGTSMASFEDVNRDGLLDLVVHLSTEALQLSETDAEAILEGQTFDGTPIRGTDSVRIVP